MLLPARYSIVVQCFCGSTTTSKASSSFSSSLMSLAAFVEAVFAALLLSDASPSEPAPSMPPGLEDSTCGGVDDLRLRGVAAAVPPAAEDAPGLRVSSLDFCVCGTLAACCIPSSSVSCTVASADELLDAATVAMGTALRHRLNAEVRSAFVTTIT